MASDDWELHKDTISCLFLLEKLSLQDVSVHMKEEYNFDRKKHQYEYQLKKWGIKKNLQKDVWRYVGHKIRKRKIVGKRSKITLFGMQLPPDKVRKEVQRYTTIPTAKDFERGVPSPTNPGWDIVRIVTPSPPDFQHKWPATLPWLRFMEGFRLDLLQVPNMAKLLVTARAVSSQTATENPLALYTRINDLARSIPQNHENDDQNARASLWTGGPSAIAIESLKVIFFSLANNNIDYWDIFGLSSDEECDKFILWLLESISESNFEWSVHLLGTGCSTTNAISEAVYGCAVRQRRYALISRLLKAGVDPNIPIRGYIYHKPLSIERGKIHWNMKFDSSRWKSNALEIAVEEHDIRLGTILLNQGVNIGTCTPPLLERIAFSMEEDNALEFVQLLMGYNVESEALPALSIAIAKRHNRLSTFLVEKVRQMAGFERLISYSLDRDYNYFNAVGINSTLLHIAIISENTAMIDFLLEATLACTDIVSKKSVRDLFVVACLAGDHSTIEKLVNLDVDWGGYWTLGVSPLVATAWNPDIRIAEMILRCGAFFDHDIDDFPQTSVSPLPIHVATRSGNTNFVQ
ncbi:hypothetical protein F4801DRAFT_544006 [Xylaria longipes]|nr:hypothetical protein F4801DRAFT_544006 [Xylaria longipes]